ncbi:hypothetical protein PCL_06942 [Purpureocillium lilacinum]|uniref:Uncharacterized protein n=1 Tax=Purpureocillium lilacinum TaxID=33203 RepID=A0A2U3DTE3_PURLI|nr:hypothetical protein PCL_06942 [Purpureocillium lilacinum]
MSAQPLDGDIHVRICTRDPARAAWPGPLASVVQAPLCARGPVMCKATTSPALGRASDLDAIQPPDLVSGVAPSDAV